MTCLIVLLVLLLTKGLGISSPLQDQSYSGLDYGMYDYPEQRDEDYQVTEPGDPEEYEEMVPTTVHSQVMTRPTRAYKRYESGHVYQEYNCEAYCSASCHTLSLLAVAAGGVAVLYRLLATL
ncbi:hypothetical protein J6590_036872 [Homalodisca vitripennis]|nr:hypothetical protein J6590_036872 [Homalodisca vitripennis]